MFIECQCLVHAGMYETNNKKYLELALSPEDTHRVEAIQRNSYDKLTKRNIRIPLEINILKVKVPYKNNRVSCVYNGGKTIQELLPGDTVRVKATYNGPWTYGDFCGLAWTLSLITTPNLLVLPSSEPTYV